MSRLIWTGALVAITYASPSYAQLTALPVEVAGANKNAVTVRTSFSHVTQTLNGEVDYFLEEKKVFFEWWYSYGDGEYHPSYQEEVVSFRPTEVACVGENLIAVAGSRLRSGHTVIEVWQLAPPSQIQLPVMPYPPGSGGLVYPRITLPIVSRQTVFDEDTAGKRIGWTMFQHHGVQSSLLVQFWDSRDIYSMNWQTGASQLVLSASLHPTVPTALGLNNLYELRSSSNHSVEGYVYMLHGGIPEGTDATLIQDSNRDGVFDSWSQISLDQYRTMGLADTSTYIEIY